MYKINIKCIMDFEFSIEESRNEGALNGYCNLMNVDLLHEKENESSPVVNRNECIATASKIVSTLRFYGFDVVSVKATVGFAFTFYEVVLKSGTRLVRTWQVSRSISRTTSAASPSSRLLWTISNTNRLRHEKSNSFRNYRIGLCRIGISR